MREKICGIYSIKSPSNRYYVGQSVDIYKRWGCYERLKTKSQHKLQNSLMKYGVDNHKFEIIEKCEISELDDREEFWGIHYDVLKSGLNSALRMTRQIFSEETRKIISEKRKLQIISPESRKRGAEKRKLTWVTTDEFRKKCSEASKGRPSSLKGKQLDMRLKELRFKNQYVRVIQFSMDGGLMKQWISCAEAARYYNLKSANNIRDACRGMRKDAAGFKWMFTRDCQENGDFIYRAPIKKIKNESTNSSVERRKG